MAGRVPVAKSRTQKAYTPRTPQRKRTAAVIDLTGDDDDDELAQSKPKRRKTTTPKKSTPKKSPRKGQEGEAEEKRARRWRSHAPSTYHERHHRALQQRMFVLDRSRSGDVDSPTEELTMAGSTGNLYTVTVSTVPSCTCPDNRKGNQCKHIIYAMVRVLKAPAQLQYQLAFLSSELKAMFAAAPLPSEEVSEDDADAEHPNNRKPTEGDCPICFCDMADDDAKDLVWCKAACGNNVHKSCFQQWVRSSRSSGKVRCVYCRSDWVGDGTGQGEASKDGRWKGGKGELAALRANAILGEDGYVNVGEELGLDVVRDSSTYHQPWRYGRW